MKRFSLAFLVALALIAPPDITTAATSTSTVGQNFAPTACNGSTTFTALQFESAAGNPYTVATAGVITSWSFQTGSIAVPGLKLEVARPQSVLGSYLFVGEAAAGMQTPNAVNTYPANIPVQAGDIIGIYFGAPAGAPCYVPTLLPNDQVVYFDGDPAVNTVATVVDGTSARIPVSATVTTKTPDAATCNGIPATIVGTPGNDVLSGTPGRDVMAGLGGSDKLNGNVGNDLLCGGKGKDVLLGQGGKDVLLGQAGKDKLNGGNGTDTLMGGKGKDVCRGGKSRKDSASGCEVEIHRGKPV